MVRKYEDYGVDYSAEVIVSECMKYGKSSDWAGNKPAFMELTKRLLAYNVFYVDDFLGTWEHITPESVGEKDYKIYVKCAKDKLS